MLTEADIASVRYARVDDVSVEIKALTRCFAPVHEELVVAVAAFPERAGRNHTLTLGFDRDGQPQELSAFVILSEIEYTPLAPEVIRFTSLGGYIIAPADPKER